MMYVAMSMFYICPYKNLLLSVISWTEHVQSIFSSIVTLKCILLSKNIQVVLCRCPATLCGISARLVQFMYTLPTYRYGNLEYLDLQER
jgi:hypothetical protein